MFYRLSHSTRFSIHLACVLNFILIAFMAFPQTADAVSQFSRKYKVECSTCHTVFPRLNAFGEEFMFNGFQWPGEKPDGSKVGKEEISDELSIDQVGHWLGARLNLTAVKYKSNGLTKNGLPTDSLNFGNSNALQLFVAGSIFKNVSIFIEQEFEESSSKFNWFHLFFTNLTGTYTNFQVGRLSPVDFTPYSDRLRIFQKSDIMNVKSSGGTGSNSVNVRSPRPGIQYYGYSGPLIWFGGLDNGKDFSDTDRQKNYWAGARLYLPFNKEGPFGGTSIGYHFYQGLDTGVNGASVPIAALKNYFKRHTLSANVRYNNHYDLQFVYQFARDNNFTLTSVPTPLSFNGFTITGAYLRDNWYAILQYDQVNSGNSPLLKEVNKLTPSIWYLFRNNFKVGMVGRVDVSGAVQKAHEFGLEIRTMF